MIKKIIKTKKQIKKYKGGASKIVQGCMNFINHIKTIISQPTKDLILSELETLLTKELENLVTKESVKLFTNKNTQISAPNSITPIIILRIIAKKIAKQISTSNTNTSTSKQPLLQYRKDNDTKNTTPQFFTQYTLNKDYLNKFITQLEKQKSSQVGFTKTNISNLSKYFNTKNNNLFNSISNSNSKGLKLDLNTLFVCKSNSNTN